MTDLINQHFAEFLIALGIILLAVEVAILGFATFILFFIGLSLVITGIGIWVGLLTESWSTVLLANAVLTTFLAITLWKPLKKLQNQTDNKVANNDFVGLRFITEQVVSREGLSQHKYSGINWTLKSDAEIAPGTEVEVVKAEVGTFWVQAVSQ
ncbi:NfeD family protein [Catenovulum adriaticum]|uniref:NfeD family protein n=1 Tax=Catenovulum adriaticum TaxID=2984846 RepID=A0ABY7ALC7_9ALTE|nr:NfeD family protein [Catenovulum sp. TS8]WAJ70355.1 NfeD family protein [Catenovulum sp. TS8]